MQSAYLSISRNGTERLPGFAAPPRGRSEHTVSALARVLVLVLAWVALTVAVAGGSVAQAAPSFYIGVEGADGRYTFTPPTYQFIYATPVQTTPTGSFAAPLEYSTANRWTAKYFVGVRPWTHLGFEASYADWGHQQFQSQLFQIAGNTVSQTTREELKTTTLEAVGFLPIGRAELFAKAGGTYDETAFHATANEICTGPGVCALNPGGVTAAPACFVGQPCSLVRYFPPLNKTRYDSFDFTYGAGAQLHLGPFALRAEHERFKIGRGGHMTSIGVLWQFP